MAENDARTRKEDLGLEPREADLGSEALPLCWNPFLMHILLLKKKNLLTRKKEQGAKEGGREEGRKEGEKSEEFSEGHNIEEL